MEGGRASRRIDAVLTTRREILERKEGTGDTVEDRSGKCPELELGDAGWLLGFIKHEHADGRKNPIFY